MLPTPYTLLRTIGKHVIPRAWRPLIRDYVDPVHRQRRGWEMDRWYGRLVFEATHGVVVAGPFAGMQYIDAAQGSTLGPKLLGTYECELNSIISHIVESDYDTVINLGAGEGYYVVGLARLMPHTQFIGFEASDENQARLRRLAELNGVNGRLDIRGWCDLDSLAPALADSGRTLVICDIEGGEIDVLRPDMLERLQEADLLVEMHDIMQSGISDEIHRRFMSSHQISVIWGRRRYAADWPDPVRIALHHRRRCLSERRGGRMSWFWMEAMRTSQGVATPLLSRECHTS